MCVKGRKKYISVCIVCVSGHVHCMKYLNETERLGIKWLNFLTFGQYNVAYAGVLILGLLTLLFLSLLLFSLLCAYLLVFF